MDTPDFRLSAAEFDLVHGDLGLGRVPFPLSVPSLGATMAARAELTGEAYRGLADRGLAVGGRLDSGLEGLLRLLAAPTTSVDAVGHAERSFRALAVSDGHTGVLAELAVDELWLSEIRPTALATSVVGVLPPGGPGPGRAVQPFRRELLARVVDEDDEEDFDPFAGDLDDETALVRAGFPARDAATLTDLADNRRAGGQFGVSHGATRASTLVTWFDTHQGRYLMTSDGGWISIASAGNERIEHRVAEVLSTVS